VLLTVALREPVAPRWGSSVEYSAAKMKNAKNTPIRLIHRNREPECANTSAHFCVNKRIKRKDGEDAKRATVPKLSRYRDARRSVRHAEYQQKQRVPAFEVRPN